MNTLRFVATFPSSFWTKEKFLFAKRTFSLPNQYTHTQCDGVSLLHERIIFVSFGRKSHVAPSKIACEKRSENKLYRVLGAD